MINDKLNTDPQIYIYDEVRICAQAELEVRYSDLLESDKELLLDEIVARRRVAEGFVKIFGSLE